MLNKEFKSTFILLLKDIRFWILLFFAIRLIGISNAPLEIAHNWRQTFTNMVSRNFYIDGLDLLHPTVDFAGERTGIVGSEFPLFNLFIYLFNEAFSYEHWYGRLINLIVSSIGVYFFYRIVKTIQSQKIALTASLILSCSMWFSYSRKIMPDTFSTSIMLIAFMPRHGMKQQYANSHLKRPSG